MNPAKRNVLDLKNETCKNLEKRNVLKKSHTRHFKTTKKQSKTGCFYSFWTANKQRSNEVQFMRYWTSQASYLCNQHQNLHAH